MLAWLHVVVIATAGCTGVLGIGDVVLDPDGSQGVPPRDDTAAQVCRADACTTPPSLCHADLGTCVDDRCVYAFADGVACTGTAPPAECIGSVLRTYSDSGSCAAGACAFPFAEQTCLAGCSNAICNTPPECEAVCDRIVECGGVLSQCRTKCRDRCTRAELNQLAVCAGASCLQIAQCIDLVSCIP